MTTRSVAQVSGGPSPLLTRINRHKFLLQTLIAVVGLGITALLAARMVSLFGLDLSSRSWERGLRALAKPAQLGTFALMALWAARLAVKRFPAGGLRTFFRFLQVAHTPIGLVVGVAAVAHGLPLLLFHWEPTLSYYSGVTALTAMAVTIPLGLWTVYQRRPLTWHRWVSLAAFAAVVVHMIGH